MVGNGTCSNLPALLVKWSAPFFPGWRPRGASRMPRRWRGSVVGELESLYAGGTAAQHPESHHWTARCRQRRTREYRKYCRGPLHPKRFLLKYKECDLWLWCLYENMLVGFSCCFGIFICFKQFATRDFLLISSSGSYIRDVVSVFTPFFFSI